MDEVLADFDYVYDDANRLIEMEEISNTVIIFAATRKNQITPMKGIETQWLHHMLTVPTRKNQITPMKGIETQ